MEKYMLHTQWALKLSQEVGIVWNVDLNKFSDKMLLDVFNLFGNCIDC